MISVNKAKEEQLETVLRLRREMLAVVSGKSGESFKGEFTQLSEEYFKNGDQTTVLAFDGENAVGCATVCYITLMPTADHPTGKRAHIMNVYVRPDHRRRGIARQMMSVLLDETRDRGVTYISLDATESGKPLYKALGFDTNEENMGMNLQRIQ